MAKFLPGSTVNSALAATSTMIANKMAQALLNKQKSTKTLNYSTIGKMTSFDPGYYSDQYGHGINEDILFTHGDGYIGNLDWVSLDRFYTVDLNKEGPSGRHYIFFCRPDLNLIDPSNSKSLNTQNGVAEDPFFRYLADYYPQIISSLTAEFYMSGANKVDQSKAMAGSGLGNSLYNTTDGLPVHSLLPFLTSRAESLQLPDYTIKSDELRQPCTRYAIPYASSAIESQTGGEFDVTFRDDRYFSVRKLFYAWIYYMDGVMRNKFSPKDKYINYNAIDYATSIYDIHVDDTGENIVWWSKYTGCFPTSVPISDLSFNKGSAPDSKCSIPFRYYMYEPLSYAALIDFNFNSLGYRFMRESSTQFNQKNLRNQNPLCPKKLKFAEIYNSNPADSVFLGPNFVGRPAIYINPSTKNLTLKWLAQE